MITKKDVKKKFQEQNKALKEMQSNLNVKIEEEMKGLQHYIDQQVGQLAARMKDIENRLHVVEEREKEKAAFNYDETLVLINFPYDPSEDLMAKADEFIRNGLKVHDSNIVRATRLKGRDGKPGITKVQLESLEQKIRVLRNKINLKHSDSYQRVYVRSSKSHKERLAEANFRFLMSVIPGGDNLMLTSNGKMVKKTSNIQTNNRQQQHPLNPGQVPSAHDSVHSMPSASASATVPPLGSTYHFPNQLQGTPLQPL